jgi:hypothetical protein
LQVKYSRHACVPKNLFKWQRRVRPDKWQRNLQVKYNRHDCVPSTIKKSTHNPPESYSARYRHLLALFVRKYLITPPEYSSNCDPRPQCHLGTRVETKEGFFQIDTVCWWRTGVSFREISPSQRLILNAVTIGDQ